MSHADQYLVRRKPLYYIYVKTIFWWYINAYILLLNIPQYFVLTIPFSLKLVRVWNQEWTHTLSKLDSLGEQQKRKEIKTSKAHGLFRS